jgi:hypothetical protein
MVNFYFVSFKKMKNDFFRRINVTPAVWVIAGISFFIHVVVGSNVLGSGYGYASDELYTMAMSHNPAFGYVDDPPLVPWVFILTRLTTGNALWAIHMLSALMCAGTIMLTGRMVRLLDGSAWAQGLAALATACAEIFIIQGSTCDYNPFDTFWWGLAASTLIIIIRNNQAKGWLSFGVVAGLGLLTKITMFFWGGALVLGLLLTPQRHLLFHRFLWGGGAIALVLMSPYIFWNMAHGWATVDFFSSYPSYHGNDVSFHTFMLSQIAYMNPFSMPLWCAGLWYLFSAQGMQYRVFGWAYIIVAMVFIVMHGQYHLMSPAYLPLYAFGAMQFNNWVTKWAWLKSAYPVLLAASGLLLVPGILPLLPPSVYVRSPYRLLSDVGFATGVKEKTGGIYDLPMILADRLGWERQVQQVASVYDSLPVAERRVACMMTADYSQAGALYQFGGRYGLPQPISGHNAFYFWGTRGCTGQVVIMMGGAKILNGCRSVEVCTPELVLFTENTKIFKWYESITLTRIIPCDQCASRLRDTPIFILRKPQIPFDKIWGKNKFFY